MFPRNPLSLLFHGEQKEISDNLSRPSSSLNLQNKNFSSARNQKQQRENPNLSYSTIGTNRNDQGSFHAPRNRPGFVLTQRGLDSLSQSSILNQKYHDREFPPSLESIVGDLSDQEIQHTLKQPRDYFIGIEWLRPDEIYGRGNYRLFQNESEPNDIYQGYLGNCYLLGSLSALAESSDRIKKIFIDQEVNDQGKYRVKICTMGIWEEVVVDDYFPCDRITRQPIFASSRTNELWVLILEKAWAKIYGSYARTVAGLSSDCLHDFTGAPTKSYLTDSSTDSSSLKEQVWNEISEGEKKNYAMTCDTFYSQAENLVATHNYSLLSAVTVKDKDNKNIRLVKLRNPHGLLEWIGAWSDKAPQWTPELRRKLKLESADDGIFFMSFEDMWSHFGRINICEVRDNFSYHSLKSRCNPGETSYFKLIVPKVGQYYITINQESKRKHAKREKYSYSKISLALQMMSDYPERTLENLDSEENANNEVWVSSSLNKGEYWVRVKIDWKEKINKEFSISSYGPGKVEIQKTKKEDLYNELLNKEEKLWRNQTLASSQNQRFEQDLSFKLHQNFSNNTIKYQPDQNYMRAFDQSQPQMSQYYHPLMDPNQFKKEQRSKYY